MEAQAHHYLGIEMNQQVWALLGQESRDDKDARRMEHFALASLHHWERSPSYAPINSQRGHWLLCRVYVVLGRNDEAILHAERCMALTSELALSGFDLAYAHEGMARAHALSGDVEQASAHYRRAAEEGAAIEGDEDKKIFMGDLEGAPWFGMNLSVVPAR